MTFGERFPGHGPDALFSTLFLMATALNYLPVALGGATPELVAGGLLHLVLAFHIGTARSRATKQRRLDLERFQAIKRAEEEEIEAKTMQLRALRLAREGHAPAHGGAVILIPHSD